MSGLENAIDHDFVDTLVCVDGYLYLNELYSSFLDRNPTTRQRYNFSVFLKTFQGLPLPILTAIAKEIQSLIPSLIHHLAKTEHRMRVLHYPNFIQFVYL